MQEKSKMQASKESQPSVNKEIGPNLFASVMGTGIVANAGVGLPMIGKYLDDMGLIIWIIASLMLVILLVLKVIQTIVRPHIIKRQFNDPVMAQFFGAPPMALLTIAGGAILFGQSLFTLDTVLLIAWTLWFIGTISGFITAVAIPYRLFTHHEVRGDAAFGGWLMPVVPPMVSAAIGAMLIPYVTDVISQQTMLYACYAMFGVSFFCALIIITLIWSRLAHSGTSGGARVPTLWIVLGPLGQSITAAGALGTVALFVVDPVIGRGMNLFSILFGVPVWGFALFWSMIAGLLTIRALRKKMPFALTWWAFTFPVGTCVTGTSQLAHHTNLPALEWAAVIVYAGLILAWIIAAIGTLKGLKGGHIIKTPPASVHVIAKKQEKLGV